MGKPAARISDMHVCPMVTPGTPPIPHVGGPIMPPGTPTVLIGGLPAAGLGSMCTCVGPPDSIIMGSTGVFIGGIPAARMGDNTAHGGTIAAGCPTVLIGEISPGVAPATVALNIMNEIPPKSTEIYGQIVSLMQAALLGSKYALMPKSLIDVVKLLSPSEEKEIEKSEIHFKLVDQNGDPVKGENFKVTLPDGSKRTGKTDDKGEVHIKGFDPGTCKISFPDIDAEDWA